MNHEISHRNETQPESSDRSFGLVFCAVFMVITLSPLLSGGKARFWALLPSVVFLLFSLLQPSLLAPLNRMWTKLGLILHRVASLVVLTMLFFIVLTPLAIVMRLFRKHVLRLSREPDSDSYWIVRKTEDTARQSMKKQF